MKILLIVVGLLFTNYCFAQNTYEIRADTVRIYNTLLCNGTGCGGPTGPPPIIITLPSASGILGREYKIKRNAAGCVWVVSAGGTLEGAIGPTAAYSMNSFAGNDWATFISDGTNWKIINRSYVIPTIPIPVWNDVMAAGNSTAYGLNIGGDANTKPTPGVHISYNSQYPTTDIATFSSSGFEGQITMYTSDSYGKDTAQIDLYCVTADLGSGMLSIRPDGGRGDRSTVVNTKRTFTGGIATNAKIITADYTTSLEDYTIISVATTGNPLVTLTGEPGTIYVLVEEAANPVANGMKWTPGISCILPK